MVEPSVSWASAFIPKAAALVGVSVAAYWSQQHGKILGGTLPERDLMSWRPEHKEAERRRFLNMVLAFARYLLSQAGWDPHAISIVMLALVL